MAEFHSQAPSQVEILAILETALPAYHDLAQLAASPLARWQIVHRAPGQQVGNRVQAVLAAALDVLRLGGTADAEDAQGRAYVLLDSLYRKGLPPKEIFEELLGVGKRQFYRERQRAMQALAAVLCRQETAAIDAWYQSLPPASYSRLFGRDSLVAGLLERLADQEGPGVIVLDGACGIGKTALGREAARWALRSGLFTTLVWQTAVKASLKKVSVEEQTQAAARPAITPEALLDGIAQELGSTQWANLPTPEKQAAIARRLAERPTLLVVDNLDTVADGRALLDLLQQLARTPGTRVLITSRHRLENFDPLSSVHVQPLSVEDTLALVRHIAAERGLDELANASDAQLGPIASVVKGQPLAAKLVTGLASKQPLDQVFQHLQQPEHQGECFYSAIHRHLWDLLSQDARQVLFSLPHMAQTGALPDDLLAVSGLTSEALAPGLAELTRCSLVEQVGSDAGMDLRYRLHPMTRYILISDLFNQDPASFREKAQRAAQWAMNFLVSYSLEAQPLTAQIASILQALDSALAYSGDTTLALQLALALHQPMIHAGLWSEWEPYVSETLALAQRLGQRQAEFHLLCALGDVRALRGDWQFALVPLQAAMGLARGAEKDWHVPFTRAAECQMNLGRPMDAQALLARALRRARRLNDERAQIDVLAMVGRARAPANGWRSAVGYFEAALALARQADSVTQIMSNLNFLGIAYRELGRLSRARECFDEALTLTRRLGERAGEGVVLSNLGVLHLMTGDLEAAQTALGSALAIHRSLGHPVKTALTLVNMGRLGMERNELTSAGGYLAEAVQIASAVPYPSVLARACWATGDYYKASGEAAVASLAYARAKALFRQAGQVYQAGRVGQVPGHSG